ncbi:MAG TPA: diaminopimelate decarboxylase [Chloroflexaceae bacterium]|nr:diaminopimelate decarboxylase [Chloroflexaceae bacterium]
MKSLPFSAARARAIAAEHPTPFYLYDEAGIRRATRALARAFAWAPGFRNYFAVKATPNPHILALLAEEGSGADCSSLPELLLAERAGLTGEGLMFTSNNTPAEEFVAARRLGALINLDDLGHLDYLARHAGLPAFLSYRYNPGPLREGNAIIGRPEEAKFGVTREQLFAGYAAARDRGVARFGLHAMVVSNELDPGSVVATAHMLFALAAELSAALGIGFELINLGGGVGIPYRPEDEPVDLATVGAGVRRAYEAAFAGSGLQRPALAMECGRTITGPHGYLVAAVRHLKTTYRRYAGLDATMANLMRPGMYGAYHHVTVLGKEGEPATEVYDLTGSLCENNDKFAVARPLPPLAVGDLVAIHDAGAHGHAMGFNYNGKLRSAELLLREDGSARLIRRAETTEDYFATLVE